MKRKVFPGVDKMPRATASEKTEPGCIVLEGGAFRGTYTEGVLDALMENDINMECTVGVSAGAMNGMNYVSGQIGRAARMTLRFRGDSRYIGLKALIKDKGLVGFDFLFGKGMELEWFDRKRFECTERRFVAVTTNCITGQTEYFDKDTELGIDEAVKASAALPIVSQAVKLAGVPHFDGGCSCKIPYRWAIDNDYNKIIVVKTRHSSFRKPIGRSALDSILKIRYRKYPKLLKALEKSNENYNRQCDELEELEKCGRVYVISPSEPLSVSRFESDLNKLAELYYLGYNDTISKIDEIKRYLNKNIG